MGAGKVQRSVYLFPYDLVLEIEEAVENFGLGSQVEVFPADLRFIRNKRKFARRVWKLGKIERQYKVILNEISALLEWEGREKKRLVKEVRARFFEVLLSDPCLPAEFLPRNWVGERVKALMKKPPFSIS